MSFQSMDTSKQPVVSTDKDQGIGINQKGHGKCGTEHVNITQDLMDKLANEPTTNTAPFLIEAFTRETPDHDDDNHWKWKNAAYVILPQSPENTRRSTGPGWNMVPNWATIISGLVMLRNACEKNEITTDVGRVLNEMVKTYCPKIQQISDFQILNRPDLQKPLLKTLPIIVNHAMDLPNSLSEPIPKLTSGKNMTIYLTRRLCCSLLANAFLCTFPPSFKKGNFPDFNFYRLFKDDDKDRSKVRGEKMKCILNYFLIFDKMSENFQNEIVSFERRYIREKENWKVSTRSLCDVNVNTDKNIEEAEGMLQVDFANKSIGGGVLGKSVAMEEIRFCISPELIVSMLFTEKMGDNEVVIITGSQIYIKYKGYRINFKFDGPFPIDLSNRPLDKFGRTISEIVAMDAMQLSKNFTRKQFETSCIDRELHKCKVGFTNDADISKTVATGRWGCGAFNGDVELKFMLQWMAASQVERPRMQYHTWGDSKHTRAVQDVTVHLQRKKVNVGQLYQAILKFKDEPVLRRQKISVFNFLRRSL